MTLDLPAPELRDLPPGRLEMRKHHLLREIAREASPSPRLTRRLPQPRLALVVSAGIATAAAAAILSLSLNGGSSHSSDLAVRSVNGQSWSALNLAGATHILEHGVSSLPTTHRRTEISGGTKAERGVLRKVVAGVQPTAIDRVAITSSGPRTLDLHFTTNDKSSFTAWQESLVAAAFRDRLKVAGIDDAVAINTGDEHGPIASGPSVTLPPAKVGASLVARRTFRAAVKQVGARLIELRTYRPDGIAVAAKLTTDHPAAFLLHDAAPLLAAIGNRWADYDGVYLVLVDTAGRPVWATSTIARTSTGSIAVRKVLAGCAPFAGWGETAAACPLQ
jgi:hypothetical protein